VEVLYGRLWIGSRYSSCGWGASVRRVRRVEFRTTLDRLVAAASLPPVAEAATLPSLGLDNQLLLGKLVNDQQVLLRQGRPSASPAPRARFLELHQVGAPRLWAADDTGAILVDFVAGETMVAAAERGAVTDDVWRHLGQAYAQVHRVQFPASLTGTFGPQGLELGFDDPVERLLATAESGEPWVSRHRPSLAPSLDRLKSRIEESADEIRAEIPCLCHGDPNWHNVIVGGDSVTLIDWDFPAVQYPLDELAGVEEHAYLHGFSELPAAFFAGYGRDVSRPLLRLYRIASCLRMLSSPDWAGMLVDEAMPAAQLAMIRTFYQGWSNWFDHLPHHLNHT
jgi:aminoglycoside phosphotransferase (APT) family kinase protein